MTKNVDLVEVWRGSFLECTHQGMAVVCDAAGEVIAQWGNTDAVILPRSSCKIFQAMPLVESGAAAKFGLTPAQLALSCASHQGAVMHTSAVLAWLDALGLGENDLRCGSHDPTDRKTNRQMICGHQMPDQTHNNCSGKHAGFLTLNKYLGGDAEYLEIDHPVQQAVKSASEELCGEDTAGFAIDGCSAPNFGVSLRGLAAGMARLATPDTKMGRRRVDAAQALVAAMARFPELVAGEGRACTDLMRASKDETVVKTGAEGVFTAILPKRGLGVALKVADGATRASECAMAALLVRLGVAVPTDPLIKARLRPDQLNRRDIVTGYIQPSENLYANGAAI